MGDEDSKQEVKGNTQAVDGTISGTPTPTKPQAPTSQSLLTPSSSSSYGLTAENIIDLSQPEPSSSKPVKSPSTTHLPRRVSASEGTPLRHPIPKPRSNSALQSSRPAPPSPAPSRPSSQIYSPGTSSPVPSSPGKEPHRDRAGSTSSSRGGIGRRPSAGAPNNRASSKPRPRSALGSSFIAPGDETPPVAVPLTDSASSNTPTAAPFTPSATLPDSSLTSTAIPEHPSPRSSTSTSAQGAPDASPDPAGTPKTATSPTATSPTAASTSSTPVQPTVIIRDFAFAPSDPRFEGPGLPLSAPDQPSRQSSRWFGGSEESGSSKRSWSGFGFMSFRNFMRKKDSNDPSTTGEDDLGLEDEEREEEFPITLPDHDEDDYAFSSDSGVEEDEPWGLYRAVYPFEAVGEHEIGLEEGDLVDLRGRGGGDGWVVGVKRVLNPEGKLVGVTEEGEEKEGLVPESYLEKVDLKILLREREKQGSTTDEQKARQEAIPEEGEEVGTPTVATTRLGSSDKLPTRTDEDGQSTKQTEVVEDGDQKL